MDSYKQKANHAKFLFVCCSFVLIFLIFLNFFPALAETEKQLHQERSENKKLQIRLLSIQKQLLDQDLNSSTNGEKKKQTFLFYFLSWMFHSKI